MILNALKSLCFAPKLFNNDLLNNFIYFIYFIYTFFKNILYFYLIFFKFSIIYHILSNDNVSPFNNCLLNYENIYSIGFKCDE